GKTIKGAASVFPGKKTAVINIDSTYSKKGDYDRSTIEAALKGAEKAFMEIGENSKNILFISIPIEGYEGNMVIGKGSALKLLFDETALCSPEALVLLDGDLRNDTGDWLRVYKNVFEIHNRKNPGKDFFITARYARHFVDASLTRNVVGPLTAIMGKYVPGGISGDIVLSPGAAGHERKAVWNEARLRYGTDIATTFDNIANGSIIYEVYLGAKLHDITDDAKLAVMPGEVIGAALERILYYEKKDGRISALLSDGKEMGGVIKLGPEKTGINFIDPGKTDVFNIDAKRKVLTDKYESFRDDMKKTLREKTFNMVEENYAALKKASEEGGDEPLFMGIDSVKWTEILYEVLGYMLKTEDIESSKRALNYLYTCAFLEFCRDRLKDLGAEKIPEIREIQKVLGVPADKSRDFYSERVDRIIEDMVIRFYKGRSAILERKNEV
ncbi:MAG: hypothetical protein ACLFQK_04160, partial [Fibrobacterota bacterium]